MNKNKPYEIKQCKNWIVCYYDKDIHNIGTLIINDRTEHEAENEATADMPPNCADWTLIANFKRQIAEMPYESMLKLWWYAPIGHPMLRGSNGRYFSKIMKEKLSQLSIEENIIAQIKLAKWD